ncbi:hypothetical protein H257_05824 [Aphanomyces astaci]|uniref:Uncharacterized protein n=1 Tax=Aphanomyces astaci TaxID=112090 RepID=W4GNI6_APHAT|nr:hypothetical protein H257_05824 [Aphanomyces astaci]ETV81262.1 hypothetical protein H257_05824 [Aphanomyces astaci]|eukprot:XP_009829120.1 hypothetical protein H257_05824 [Aphanomyces astaci]
MLRLRGILRERNAVESVALHDDQSDAAWYTMYRSRNTPSFLTTVDEDALRGSSTSMLF